MLREEDEFPGDLALLQKLIGAGRFAEGQLFGNNGTDLTGRKQIEEFAKVFAEPVWMLVAEMFDVVPKGVFAGEKFQQAERCQAEAGEQLPFRDGGAGPIAGEHTAGAQATVRSEPVFPTNRIENAVHAAR